MLHLSCEAQFTTACGRADYLVTSLEQPPCTPTKGKAMNALKTAANQIKTLGTLINTIKYNNSTADIYRVDTVTNAIIYIDKRGHVQQVTFEYAMK